LAGVPGSARAHHPGASLLRIPGEQLDLVRPVRDDLRLYPGELGAQLLERSAGDRLQLGHPLVPSQPPRTLKGEESLADVRISEGSLVPLGEGSHPPTSSGPKPPSSPERMAMCS